MSSIVYEPNLTKTDTTENKAAPVAYVMSRFPKLTETFVLYEILEAERSGTPVEVYPLQREACVTMHREAEAVVAKAHFTPWISWAIIQANLLSFLAAPVNYVRTFLTVVWANLGSLNYLGGGILFFPKAVYMARDMRLRGVTHLHAHFCSHPAAVAFIVHKMSGISYSFTAHGSDLHCDRHMLKEKVENAASVMAISAYNRDLILEECGQQFASKVHVLHCGVDTHQFEFRAVATAFDRGAGPMAIVCTGTLHEVKGQRYLLDACAELDRQNRDFRCHFIGSGADLEMLQSHSDELGISSKVVFHGSQTRQQVLKHLAVADVLVAPSVPTKNGKREGIPVVLMEAMACGVPCIGSDLSGIPELLAKDCGILTPPRDSGAIADALLRLQDDAALRKEMSVNGRRRVEVAFDLGKNTRQLMSYFP